MDKNDVGYVADYFGANGNEIILGKRNQITTINSSFISYNFNKNMALTFRLRHYWSSVKYNEFHSLTQDGLLDDTTYDEFNDLSFNSFNIDMIYRWRFASGSDIFFIWKNAANGVDSEPNSIQYSYGKGAGRLGEFPQSNSFSLKAVYYLDYLSLARK